MIILPHRRKHFRGDYTTWNPSDKTSNITLSNGNLTATHGGATVAGGVRTIGNSTNGKLYYETSKPNNSSWSVGFALDSVDMTTAGGLASGVYILFSNGSVYTDGASQGSSGLTLGSSTMLRVAIDLVAQKIWFADQTGWGSGDPALGTGGFSFSTSGNTHGYFSAFFAGTTATAEFGVSFTYAPPSGFIAIPK